MEASPVTQASSKRSSATISLKQVYTTMNELTKASLSDLRRCWKRLIVTGIYYQLVAVTLLTPFVSILFRMFIAASGRAILADQDILMFLASPFGWLALVSVGALWLSTSALQLAAMMAILAEPAADRLQPLAALRFAMGKARPTIHLAARVAIFVSIWTAPFLVVVAVVYFSLLAEFDINFYLKRRNRLCFSWPWALLDRCHGPCDGRIVLLRLFTGWVFALPMVLFENVSPARALELSRKGVRLAIVMVTVLDRRLVAGHLGALSWQPSGWRWDCRAFAFHLPSSVCVC